VTLPVLYALEDPDLAPCIRSIQPGSPAADIDAVLAAIRRGDALDRSELMRRQYLREALLAVEPLRSHPAYGQLEVLHRYFGGKTA
ncbi:polyprenyl synthetase family protein, partial [Paenibacillus chibensis]|nr:polyprenyl synthetase family protein [Paenibacillus chibensis]